MGESTFIMDKEDDFFPEVLEEKPRRSLTLMILNGIFSRRSFSYDKLPSELLRLSVLKLDGSRFDIEVKETATIAETKQAVEAAFSCMPKEEEEKISWEHVWGQFCLCYDGQKLVTETDHIRDYGIEDGDELLFIRHDSDSSDLRGNKLKKRASSRQRQRRSLSDVNECHIGDDDGIDLDIENGRLNHYNNDEDHNGNYGKRLPFFGGLFSYSRLAVREEQEPKPGLLRQRLMYWAALGRLRGFYPFVREDASHGDLRRVTADT